MGYETLEYERDGHVGWLRLNRPEKLNAMNGVMWSELARLGPELRDDPDLRALVVIGNGRSFSAGIDLSSFGGDGAGQGFASNQSADRERAVAATQEGYLWLQEAWYPTIAAVRGHALGAGMQLAVACDLRVAAAGSRFGMLEARYGLMPDLTGTQLLPRVVGPAKAKELIFMAEMIDAEEAYRIGLVNRLVDDAELESAAGALATKLAAQPPIAMRWSKRAVEASTTMAVRDGLRFEHQGQAECIGSEDFREAISAFLEKRPANFTGK
ncbi:MAG TPA: enoyl-CoA hydratase-related protein [Acidimicrobiales bacterium]|jgi:enoyl-CoA hydratase/carnithine racemase